MKGWTFLVAALLMSGCASFKAVDANYSAIKYDNGVSQEEAKIIAKKSLMESAEFGEYRFAKPKMLRWNKAFGHPNYWFIAFSNKNPLAPNHYLVVVDKRNGEIRYSAKQYPYPKMPDDYHFIFNLDKSVYDWHAPNES